MKRGPLLATKRLGGAATVAKKRALAGIPDDAPKDKNGHSCVEKTCPACGETFLAKWAQRQWRTACSPKCAGALKRQKTAGTRKGAKNPNFRNGTRTGVRDRTQEPRWYAAAKEACEHPDCPGARGCLALHHIIYSQHVVREHGDKWDPRNAMTLCNGCHMSHHRRGTYVIPLTALPDSVFEFASEVLGAEQAYEYLARRYAGTDVRLERLLLEGAA